MITTNDDGINQKIRPEFVFDDHNVPAPGQSSHSLGFFHPKWLKQDQKVTVLHDDKY